jgi:hypothetical protein
MAHKQLVVHQNKMKHIKLNGRVGVFADPEEKKKVDDLKMSVPYFFWTTWSKYMCSKLHGD